MMLQRLVIIIFLFSLPFLLFGAYLYVSRWRRQKEEEGTLPSWWDEVPWTWLMFAGVGLIFASLVWFRTQSGRDISGTYIPPRMENGEIVPGSIDMEHKRTLHDPKPPKQKKDSE